MLFAQWNVNSIITIKHCSSGLQFTYEPTHVKSGLTELEVELEISMDLCREKPRKYDAKKTINYAGHADSHLHYITQDAKPRSGTVHVVTQPQYCTRCGPAVVPCTGGFSLVHNLWDLGFLCPNRNCVLNETMLHTLAIHYPVHSNCNLQFFRWYWFSPIMSRLFFNIDNSFEKVGSTYIRDSTYNRELSRKSQQVLFERSTQRLCAQNRGSRKTTMTTTTRMKMPMRQLMLNRQTACMRVSVNSSHDNCTYHNHKYLCKVNGIQRLFLFYMNLQVAFWGVHLYSGKYSTQKLRYN